jgi:hypothetical protein
MKAKYDNFKEAYAALDPRPVNGREIGRSMGRRKFDRAPEKKT